MPMRDVDGFVVVPPDASLSTLSPVPFGRDAADAWRAVNVEGPRMVEQATGEGWRIYPAVLSIDEGN